MLLSVACGLCAAQGTVFRYASDRQVMKVCVLQIPNPGLPGTYYPPANAAVFAVLDRLPQKPADWDLDNPLAPPGTVHDDPAYWVVPLNPGSAERLAEFDLILIASTVAMDFATPVFPFPPAIPKQSSNDLLRRIADNGVTLWFDARPGMAILPAGAFSIPFNFVAGGPFSKAIYDRSHPLVSSIYHLGTTSFGFLGGVGAEGVEVVGFAPALHMVLTDGLVPPRTAVAAGSWVGGRVVVTSCDVSGAIAGIGAGARVPPAELADVLFAYNLLGWCGEWPSERQGPRRGAAVSATAVPPLGIKWQYPGPMDAPAALAIGPATAAPVAFRGMVYYAARAPGGVAFTPGLLLAFDANPKMDLDGDGWPDDGVRDFSNGEPYDLVWSAPLSGDPFCVSPAVATVDASLFGGAPGEPMPVVLASSAAGGMGHVQAFNAVTGALLWGRNFPAGFGGGTLAVSTPVVRDDWVLFTTTEGTQAPMTPLRGRAYCVDLATGGARYAWVYPDPVFSEPPAALPPFTTLAAGGASIRAVCAPAVYAKEVAGIGRPVLMDAVMRLGGGASPPGTDCEAIPLPTGNYDAFGGALLNDGNGVTTPSWFSVPLPASYTTIDAVLYDDGATPFTPGIDYAWPLPPGVTWLTFSQRAARRYVAAGPNPTGREVIIQYTDATGPGKTIRRVLAGVVQAIRSSPTWERFASPVVGEKTVYSATNASGPARGEVHALRAADSEKEWAYDPRVSLHPAALATNPSAIHRAAPAADADTVYVATSFDLNPADAIAHPDGAALAAIQTSPSLEIRLTGGPNRIVESVDPSRMLQVQEIEGPGGVPGRLDSATPQGQADIIAPAFYTFDAPRKTIRFLPNLADSVRTLDGSPTEPIYGRAVWISYFDDNGTPANPADDNPRLEMHVVPSLIRWQYVPFTVQLSKYPLLNAAGGYATAADLAVTLARDGTPIPPGDYSVDAKSGKILFAPASAAVGQQIDVGYFYQQPGPLGQPPVRVQPPERHEVPRPFRLAESAPAVAGSTLHVGLEAGPAPNPTPERSLLSLLWDKARNLVTGWLTSVAQIPTGYPAGLAPLVGSPPAVTQDSVYVGASLSDLAPSQLADGTAPAYGFISALRSEKTLVADANRVLETNGPRLEWVCTGTQLVDPQVPTTVKIKPFARPSKVTKLSTGALLVVDTGNNRVVEIDREGNLLWPLTPVGDEADFGLREPGDAARYFGDGPGGVGMHTVIADTGNGRVVDILTTSDPLGRQMHKVTTLTPEFFPSLTTGQAVRIAYSHVQPVFANPGAVPDERVITVEPAAGATLIGYLCSALNVQQLIVINADRTAWPNVLNPTGPVGGMAGVGWKWCDWLYDFNQDGVPNDPVYFTDVRYTEITQLGPWMYFTVVCSSWGAGGTFSTNGPAVYQFQVNGSGPVAARGLYDPGQPVRQIDIALGGKPYWEFNHANYLWLDAPANTLPRPTSWLVPSAVPKRWHPVCAKILPNGDRLIVNNSALVSNATRANLPGAETTESSEILRVQTSPGFPIDPDRMIPSPNWPEWKDPFSQPVYAELN